MRALELGYHVLFEKSMSPDPLECIAMEQAAKKYNRQLTIGHVLRYTEFFLRQDNICPHGMDILVQLDSHLNNAVEHQPGHFLLKNALANHRN
jgi:hypothetical protein